jgi:hypothetical protein
MGLKVLLSAIGIRKRQFGVAPNVKRPKFEPVFYVVARCRLRVRGFTSLPHPHSQATVTLLRQFDMLAGARAHWYLPRTPADQLVGVSADG